MGESSIGRPLLKGSREWVVAPKAYVVTQGVGGGLQGRVVDLQGVDGEPPGGGWLLPGDA